MDGEVRRLHLPRLVGTREAVSDLLSEQTVPDRLKGEVLVVYCNRLVSGSSSFADELVRQTLLERDADELLLVGAPDEFAQRVSEAAQRRGVEDRVNRRAGAEVPA
jgi:hypothetical protein